MSCDRFCQIITQRSSGENGAFRSSWDDPSKISVPPMPPDINRHYCTRRHTPRRSLDFQYSTSPAEHGEPSPHHALVLQTAPRPTATVGRTLASLREAGSDEWMGPKILSSDGPLPTENTPLDLKSRWSVFQTPRPSGCARAFVQSLRLALAVDPNLELLTFVEDDVELCRNALSYIARLFVPADLSLVTWFTYNYDWSTPRHLPVRPTPQMIAHHEKRGILAVRPARYFILTQACTLTRATIDKILRCPHASREWPKREGHDELITWSLGDAPYAAHFPVLVQHEGGLNSAVRLDRERAESHLDPLMRGPTTAQDDARRSPHYVGQEFDAMSLLPKEHP
jgi:hypothetical protein